MTGNEKGRAASVNEAWATGEIFGLKIPATPEALVSNRTDFLTKAFHTSGAIAPTNRVSHIVAAEEFFGGGTGKKLLLTLAYETPEPGASEELFLKFSRNFENELWDRERMTMLGKRILRYSLERLTFPLPYLTACSRTSTRRPARD